VAESEHNSPRRAGAQAGLTTIELVVAGALLGVVVTVAVSALMHSLRVSAETSALLLARQQASIASARVHDLLREGSVEPEGGVLLSNQAPPDGRLNAITWNPVLGYDAVEERRVYGAPRRLSFVPDAAEAADGADNDGDGLVDEGQLVFQRDLAGTAREVVAQPVGPEVELSLGGGGVTPGLNDFQLNVSFRVLYLDGARRQAHIPVNTVVAFRNGRGP
jgi:hypothetical protein